MKHESKTKIFIILNLLLITSFLLCGFETMSVNGQGSQEPYQVVEKNNELQSERKQGPSLTLPPKRESATNISSESNNKYHSQRYERNISPGFFNQQEGISEVQQYTENKDTRSLDPRVFVLRFDHFIDGYDWTPNTQVTLTIDEEEPWTAQSNDDGYVAFHLNTFDIVPGQNVSMTDGEYTRNHTVRDIAVTEVNSTTNTITGTADPNSETISVHVDNGNESEWLYSTPDSEGIWEVDFSSLLSFTPGTEYWVYQSGGERTWTDIYGALPNPYIIASAVEDYVNGSEWSANKEITLTIDTTNVWTAQSNEAGEVSFGFTSFDVLPGQTVVMTDGDVIRTHIVTNLAITEVNPESNYVAGTADAGSPLGVDTVSDDYWTESEYIDLIADPLSGNWQANFSNVNLTQGSFGWAREYDDEGNFTQVYYFVPNYDFIVFPLDEYVTGRKWPANTEVTLSIGEEAWTVTSSFDGFADFDIKPFNIEAGQTVTLSASGGYTRFHTVKDITVTEANTNTDTITGTADPGSLLSVYANNGEEEAWLHPTAAEDRNWTADFSSTVDLKPGTEFGVYLQGEEKTWTGIYDSISNPQIVVFPLEDRVDGNGWIPNDTITLNISGQIWTETSDDNGNVNFDLNPFDVLPDQTVVMTDGDVTRTHVVTNLAITEVNKETNCVSGTADPDSKLGVHVIRDDSWGEQEYISLHADTSGNWRADFLNVDMREGSFGWAHNIDDEGNLTEVTFEVPDPFIEVYLRKGIVIGWDWAPNAPLAMSIAGDAWTEQTDSNGTAEFAVNTLPGQTVTMTDGHTIRTHIVKPITITEINPNTENITGTASPNSELGIYIRHRIDDSWAWMDLTADAEGSWQAELLGTLDIKAGTYCHVIQYDEEGNRSVIYSHVPDPYITVDPQNNKVTGSFWPLETEVLLSIGESQWTSMSDARGEVKFEISPFDILPGQIITMTGGGYTKIFTVKNLSITKIDQEREIIFGTAEPGSQILVRLYYDNGEDRASTVYDGTREVITNASGNWQADFSSDADIKDKYLIQATLVEADGNQTFVNLDKLEDYYLFIPIVLH